MEGTYYKEWSAVLDRAMEFKVYGHGGVPVLALPARGGRFYDWENNGMPEAAARLLHEGKMQLFCADSIDAESLLAGHETPRRRAEMQEKYFVYLTAELAPPHRRAERPGGQKASPHLVRWRGHRRLSGRPVPPAPPRGLCGRGGSVGPVRHEPLPRRL